MYKNELREHTSYSTRMSYPQTKYAGNIVDNGYTLILHIRLLAWYYIKVLYILYNGTVLDIVQTLTEHVWSWVTTPLMHTRT